MVVEGTAVSLSSFKVTINNDKLDFGYWKNNDYGYVVQLIVNGKVKSEKTVNSLQTDFKLDSYFGYKAKLDDVIQIGIRTWVVDDEGKKIFDSDFPKCSNTVCGLTKPVTAYINNN